MVFFSVILLPALLFITAGLLRAPGATFRFVGMFLLVCSTICAIPIGLLYLAAWLQLGPLSFG